jgi:hypothetical protein
MLDQVSNSTQINHSNTDISDFRTDI